MTVSAAIRRMLAAGLTIEQALVAAEAFEAEAAPQEPVLSKRQARNRRYYERLKSSEKRLNADDQDVSDAGAEPSSPEGSSPTDRAIEVFSDQASKAGLPVPRKVTADRRRKVEARIREHGEELWAEACRRMANSAFCRGENDRGWRADLDFLCQPKSFNGLIEGKYDDRPHRQSQAPPQKTAFQLHQEAFAKELDRTINGNDRYDDRPDNVVDLAATDYRYSGTPSPVRR
ncbi:DNA replication protein [Sinorhizobium meliloti]|uniref:DNA replication protein n=1 Tax=Rhizobium meliloti TaxID=382 RepID=UPI001651578A|nr:DNA replication protein [Sinorhizobium meliloti]